MEYFSTFGGDFAPIVVRNCGVALLYWFCGLDGNHAGWWIKIIKQDVVIMSCCNILLFIMLTRNNSSYQSNDQTERCINVVL